MFETLPNQRTAGSRSPHRDLRTVGSSPFVSKLLREKWTCILILLVNADFCSSNSAKLENLRCYGLPWDQRTIGSCCFKTTQRELS
jgi:hypothetical protein